ncbi:ring zinc finger protein [Grosmannia clavigera kw1407]|uniref:E3 ubiquitin-protein ligase listerin n=1 Tax=Grosmannia clavigera (strain kw1407 / UAMH 11150) TaxID=655863 RepID=F0X831_GROCL|nr:ring zinc finger protein [Grosmannia clavigera kw1407]EFX05218.1 ring zinc finger protein [Grosmannia clavigera kw1407]
MSRPRPKGRLPPPGAASFGSIGPAAGGFGGFAPVQNKSGLAYLSDRHDLSGISDANAVVQFKNLLKKDGKTKARALEELVAYAQAHSFESGGVEDAILEVWVQLFPRLSIDSERKVRELAHNVQFEFMKSAKRRMERHVPKIVGPWLAGVYDRDRAVSRAASDCITSFLSTEEKTRLFWKKCKLQILEYAIAALKETPTTLSDMRSTTEEDAALVSHRVLYSSLSLVMALLRKLDVADTDELQDAYIRLFSLDRLMGCAVSKDSHVRRAVYEVIKAALEIRPVFLEAQMERLTHTLTQDAVKTSQTGSVGVLIDLLTYVSKTQPQIWDGKVHPLTQLRPLMEKGSQGDLSHNFWQNLDALLNSVHPSCPGNISQKEAANILISFRTGISRREEPRSNAVSGWTAYLSMAKYLIGTVEPKEAMAGLAETHILPLFGHYVYPPDKSVWSTGAQLPIITRASLLCCRPVFPDVVESARAEWTKQSAALVARMCNSLPEVSKDYARSQQEIANEGDRWFSLIHDVHRTVQTAASASSGPANLVEDVLLKPTLDLVRSAADLLKRRNYKPFGAAHVVSTAFAQASHILRREGRDVAEALFPVQDKNELSLLLASPSAPQLLSGLRAMASIPECAELYKSAFSAVMVLLLESTDSETTARHITLLISDTSDYAASTSQSNEALQTCLRKLCFDTVARKLSSWDLFRAAFAYNALSQTTGKALAFDVVQVLGTPDVEVGSVLTALETIASKNPEFLPQGETHTLDLVTKLLAVTEINDPLLSSKVELLRSLIGTHSKGETPLIKIIQENLDSTGPDSLEIDTLVEQATSISKSATAEEKESLFPSTNIWMKELLQFLQEDLDPALSLTSRLGGAYLLAHGFPKQANTGPIKRDQHGQSIPARMAAYTLKVLEDGFDLSSLPKTLGVELLYMLYLVAEIGSDQIAVASSKSLWDALSDPWAASVAEDTVSQIRALLAKIVGGAQGETICQALIETMLRQTTNVSALSIYTARALSELLQTKVDSRGFTPAEQEQVAKLNIWKTSPETALGAVAVLTGYGELLGPSKTVSTFCNRLVSDVAGAKADSESTLLTLVLLNACMSVYEMGELPVATNRLVFTVRQMTTWFVTEESDSDEDEEEEEGERGEKINEKLVANFRVATESCRALQRLLPCIKDIYGPHWERSIKFCVELWTRAAEEPQDSSLSCVQASLKLMGTLEAMEEPNDDLADALQMYSGPKWQAMLGLLSAKRSEAGQAQEIVDALLCRMTRKMPLDQVKETSGLYGLMASESREVQTAGFNILHRAIPAAQEELSFNVILEKKERHGCRTSCLRSYLLSWQLVFDAFSKASAKVRGDYGEQLGTAGHLTSLLDFTFDVLGHSAAHALNLDKAGYGAAQITGYNITNGEAETDERNMQWLLVHLYYESLRYLPGSCRAWFAACRSKQTTLAVSTWTARYFSAILTGDVLDDVVAWASSQEAEGATGTDEKALQVRVNKAVREVVASYEVDDTEASMVVRLPENYPIDNVVVEGVHRVAASPKKWQSWMMIAQGVITFSNGNIIDGLLAFRRNIVGALKGQTECAICYSIVSEDKRMPDKRLD